MKYRAKIVNEVSTIKIKPALQRNSKHNQLNRSNCSQTTGERLAWVVASCVLGLLALERGWELVDSDGGRVKGELDEKGSKSAGWSRVDGGVGVTEGVNLLRPHTLKFSKWPYSENC